MRSRIIYTVSGMAVNAKHRRDAGDASTEADCDFNALPNNCPACNAVRYAAIAKHRAEATS